jgi:hypothetical protein
MTAVNWPAMAQSAIHLVRGPPLPARLSLSGPVHSRYPWTTQFTIQQRSDAATNHVESAKMGTPATASGAESAAKTPVSECSIGPRCLVFGFYSCVHFLDRPTTRIARHFASAPGGEFAPSSPAIEISVGVRVTDRKPVALGAASAARSSGETDADLMTKNGSGRSVSVRASDGDGGGMRERRD